MFKKFSNKKAEAIRWHQFSRRSDAIFLSLHKEICIGVLSVATLTFAAPASAVGTMTCGQKSDLSFIESPLDNAEDDDLLEGMDSLILAGTEVIATRVPIHAAKAVRLVQVIDRKQIEASAVQSVNDVLKLAAGVDVRQRGPFGIQTDISVNGGTDDQLTVLLNGVNISNPHTGHLTADLPVSISEVERIEVIEGGASRVYGAQAFSGVINIVTKSHPLPLERRGGDNANTSEFYAELRGGSFGTVGGNIGIGGLTGSLSHRIAVGYDCSDGGTENSDFKKVNAFYRGKWDCNSFDLNWQGGMSLMNYGANTFYGTGSRSQYEENRRFIASLGGEYKGRVRILPQIYWNRSLDHYVWTRSNPEAYQNFHQTNVYGASLNAYTEWVLGKTALGVEWRREEILSTRLGKEVASNDAYKVPGSYNIYYMYADARDNIGVYLEHDILLRDWTLSFGVLANDNSSVNGSFRFYPGVDVSYRPYGVENLKLFGSFNQSLRVSTFTDLYYNGPGLQGNSNLLPEKSTDLSLGSSYSNGFLSAQLKAFFRHGTDMIDWVKYEGSNVYTVANSDIDCAGVETAIALDFHRIFEKYSFVQNINMSYCWINKYRTNKEQSAIYATDLSYLRNKFVFSMNHSIVGSLTAQWDFTVKDRNGQFDNVLTGELQNYGTHSLLDLKLQWEKPKYTLYVQANNLLNKKYYDISNVQQPGFWFLGGVRLKLNF